MWARGPSEYMFSRYALEWSDQKWTEKESILSEATTYVTVHSRPSSSGSWQNATTHSESIFSKSKACEAVWTSTESQITCENRCPLAYHIPATSCIESEPEAPEKAWALEALLWQSGIQPDGRQMGDKQLKRLLLPQREIEACHNVLVGICIVTSFLYFTPNPRTMMK
jgi:hypothetical protein